MPIYALDGVRPILPAAGRYWIAPNASVIGDVALGEDCGIWFGATLRGDNERISLGARSNIQEGCDAAHRYRLSAGHRRRLHDRPQRDPARLRDRRGFADRHGRDRAQRRADRRGCLVGAGALVTEGKIFPRPFADRRLAGQGDPHARRGRRSRGCKWSAAHYVENWRRFAKGLDRRSAEKERPALGGGRPQNEAGFGGRIPLRNLDYGLPRGVERRLDWRAEHHPDIGVLLALALDEAIAGRRPRLHLVVEIVEHEFALVGLEGQDRMAFLGFRP